MKKYLIILVVLFGLLLRIVGLDSHPAGFTPDEASFGYDAYSILKTGKDQWGNTLPLVFKSFGDDKLPVYTYLTVPSVAIFGLNEFAVRLPNALLGSAAILVVYFLALKLFKEKKIALLASLLTAISPWHFMLSRGAFEANLTTFFLPLGILLFLKGKKYYLLAFVVFLINIFTYHSARILTPLVLVGLVYFYMEELKRDRTYKIWVGGVVVLLVIAIAGIFIGGSRVASSSIADINFKDDRYFAQIVGEPSLIAKLFYNEPIYVARQFVGNYLSYFSPQFLLTNGPAEGTYGMVPGVGVLYIVEAVFVVGAIWAFLTKKELRNKNTYLILLWILVSAIPAALTKGPGYAANRAAFIMPALQIFVAIGAYYVWNIAKRLKYSKIIIWGFAVLWIGNFLYVGEKYLVGQRVNNAPDMVYGTKELFEYLDSKSSYNEVIISKKISEPQIYAAFWGKMDPVEYQKYSSNWKLVNGWVDQQEFYKLGRYTFKTIDKITDFRGGPKLVTTTSGDGITDKVSSQVITYPNLKPAYFVYSVSLEE